MSVNFKPLKILTSIELLGIKTLKSFRIPPNRKGQNHKEPDLSD